MEKKKSIRIIVVRHCQTIMNQKDQYQGIKYDYPLTPEGILQARKIKGDLWPFMEIYPVDKCFISKTRRAKETASIICPNTEMEADSRLNPFDLGDADGKRKEEMFTILGFPLFARKKENFAKYLKRIRTFLKDLIIQNLGKTVLIVTHKDISGIIDTYLSNLFLLKAPSLGLENGQAKIFKIEIENPEALPLKLTSKYNFGRLLNTYSYEPTLNIFEK